MHTGRTHNAASAADVRAVALFWNYVLRTPTRGM